MTSIYHKLAAAAGAVLSFAAIPSGEALAQAIDASEGKYGQILEGAWFGEGFEVGDMMLRRTGRNDTVGNGIDESISWSFDFNQNPDLLQEFLNAEGPVTEAKLVLLDIGFTNEVFYTDWFGIPGYGGQKFGFGSQITPTDHKLIRVPNISGIPDVGEFTTLEIDLLANGFTSEQILYTLNDDKVHTNPWYDQKWWNGDMYDYSIYNAKNVIPFIYMDDAILREAQLTLTKGGVTLTSQVFHQPQESTVSVPEPSAIASLAVLGCGLLLSKKKKQG